MSQIVSAIFDQLDPFLGGCTAHNAMILIYPDAVDWKHIEAITGDASWSPGRMRHWFKKIEDCRHRPWLRFLAGLGIDYIRSQLDPTGPAPHWRLGLAPPTDWRPMTVVAS